MSVVSWDLNSKNNGCIKGDVMGYPMTWRRVIGRNGLHKGGYDDAGQHKVCMNMGIVGIVKPDVPMEIQLRNVYASMGPDYVRHIETNENNWKILLGDIRRLEADVADEKTICRHIATRTGVDPDTVATVLKEFMNY